MSVPLTLLGLLEREPSHGYDLKRDYDAYFGRGKPLPFGQVYATLGRLARDGKVVVGRVEPGAGPDRKRYVITDAGRHRGRAVADRAGRAGAAPADRAVRQGRARADAGPAGRAATWTPSARAPAADARAHRDQAATADLVDALLADHGAVPPGGRPALDRPDRGPAGRSRARRCGDDRGSWNREDHRGAGRRVVVRRDAGAARRQRWPSTRARSSPSWGRAAPASRPCCTAWPASWFPTRARSGSTGSRIDTMSETERSALRRDRFGFVFQFGQLVPELTAEENVALPLLLGGVRRGQALRQAGPGSTGSAWTGWSGAGPASCPAGRPSGSRWPAAWSPGRRCCSPTSRPARSTRSPASRSWTCWSPRPASRAPPSSWSPTSPGRRLRRPRGHRPRRQGEHAHRGRAVIGLGLRLALAAAGRRSSAWSSSPPRSRSASGCC